MNEHPRTFEWIDPMQFVEDEPEVEFESVVRSCDCGCLDELAAEVVRVAEHFLRDRAMGCQRRAVHIEDVGDGTTSVRVHITAYSMN